MNRWLILLAACGALGAQDKERALGEQLAAELRREATPASKPLREYVARIGQRLAAGRTGFAFDAVRGDTGRPALEPVSLPGGFVFVPVGLIAAAESEDEVARRMAHAMAHVVARHGIREAAAGGASLIYIGPHRGPIPIGRQASSSASEIEADQLAEAVMAAFRQLPATGEFAAMRAQARDEVPPRKKTGGLNLSVGPPNLFR